MPPSRTEGIEKMSRMLDTGSAWRASPLQRARRGAPRVAAFVAAGACLGVAAMAPPAAGEDRTSETVSVVVTGHDADSTARDVRRAGGTVTAHLDVVDGVAAELPAGARLRAGLVVSPDRAVTFASAPQVAAASTATSTLRETLGLQASGSEGTGVTVALVDTGVAEVADLAGRVDHIDVTGTGGGDSFGHGTFLAGLIAGSGASSEGRYTGVAPGARILDVKVADADGVTSLSAVLRGLQAVANHSGRGGVQVVNLSLSSGSPLPYQVDPLNQALRRLWHRGLTVVVSSGNDGPGAGSVASPGNDPTLLTVGGVDEAYTGQRADDTVAQWSGRGPTSQGVSKPELVAPGAHMVGLRSPGSLADRSYPQARVEEDYFRGSGTSMSAAVASGAAAGVLSANPGLGPDQVKQLFTSSAYRADGLSAAAGAGAGGLDLDAALAAAGSVEPTGSASVVAPGSVAEWESLAQAFARGDKRAAEKAWSDLDPQARSWAARSWAALEPTARSWAARSWAARSWASTEVTSQEWAARSWAARSWAGTDWAARSWAARSWAGDDWAARSWATDSWSARSWAATWR